MANNLLLNEFLPTIGCFSNLAAHLWFEKSGFVDCELSDSAFEGLAHRLVLDFPVFPMGRPAFYSPTHRLRQVL